MAFPIMAALAAVSLGASIFGPKQGRRTEGIADQIGAGDKFNETFEELMRALRGDTSQGSLGSFRDFLGADADFQLGQGASRLSGQLAKRGLAGSPVLGANIGILGQRLALGSQSSLAGAAVSGRNQALSSLSSLVGGGLNATRNADIFQTNRANQFSSGLGGFLQSLNQIFLANQQNSQPQVPS